MSEKKKTFLESRIQQFCDSSAELLSGIHAKYSEGEKGKSKRKRKKRKNTPVVSIDAHEDETPEGLI